MTEVGGIAVDRLRSLIERIERLEEEKKAIAGDIRDIFAEAKSAGLGNLVKKSLSAFRNLYLQSPGGRSHKIFFIRRISSLWHD